MAEGKKQAKANCSSTIHTCLHHIYPHSIGQCKLHLWARVGIAGYCKVNGKGLGYVDSWVGVGQSFTVGQKCRNEQPERIQLEWILDYVAAFDLLSISFDS